MNAHMADSSYDVDAASGSARNKAQPQRDIVVVNLDVTGSGVVEEIGDDTTAAVTGGTASRKRWQSLRKTQLPSRSCGDQDHYS